MSKRKLFVGSSKEAYEAGALAILIKELSRRLPSVEVVSWRKTDWLNLESALKTLTKSLPEFSYAVFLAWPDDKIEIRNKKYYSCRDNVIFEFGLFLGQLGTKRTFYVAPKPGVKMPPADLTYHFLSDIHGTFLAGSYTLTGSPPSWSPKFSLSNLIEKIQRLEKHIAATTPQSAGNELDQRIQEAEAAVTEDGFPDAYYSGYLSRTIDQFVHLRAAVTSEPVQAAAKDLLLILKGERDVCDINQLAKLQRYDVNNLGKVWVFADSPLEFQLAADKEFENLRKTIRDNLLHGVKYEYFISESGLRNLDASLLIPGRLTKDQKKKIKKNVTFYVVDKKLFKTYFTLHFKNGDKSPTSVYMSMLRKDRKDDLLIQIAESRHIMRITENIQLLLGKDGMHTYASVKLFV